MRNLEAGGLVEPIREYIRSGRPFLGVCMGQQALSASGGGEHECPG
jgi:glutamine amidotransferase/cyclase